MKLSILLFTVGLFLITELVPAQTTSFSTDFTNPSGANGTWAFILADVTDVFTKTISNGELSINYNKTQWSFIQLWIRPFDIVPYPYLKFTAKAESAGTLSIRIKDQDGKQVEKTISLTTEYQVFFFNLMEDLSTFTATLDEIQFDVGYGDYSGTLYFDDFMLGEAAKPLVNRPTIDQVITMLVFKDSGLQSVRLTGITDGGEGNQNITVVAEAGDTSLIKSLITQYTSPEDTAFLQFVPSSGKLGTSTITVTVTDDGEIENVTKMIFNVIIAEYGSTGFTDDFEDAALDTIWDQSNPDYSLDRTDGILKINVHKNSGGEYFSCRLPGIFDFSIVPYVNLDLKGDQPFIFMVQLVDMNDLSGSREIRIMESEDYVSATFDYSAETNIDLEHIKEVRFAVNPLALTYNGEIRMDNLKTGSEASPMAYLASPGDKVYHQNAGNIQILLTDIVHASGIDVNGGSDLVENLNVSGIMNGTATLSFDIISDATGSDTVTLLARGSGDFQDYPVSFIITITPNFPPTIDFPGDIVTAKGAESVIRLTGLSDGNMAADQVLTFTCMSDNEDVLVNPMTVVHSNGSPYGYITFTPGDSGTAHINLKIKDDGGGNDSVSVDFTVRVYNSINEPPEIDPVEKIAVFNDAGEQTVNLTGISDGDDGSQNLTIKAFSSKAGVVPNPIVIEYSGGENAVLKFTPNPLTTGTTVITLTINDDGGTPENDGNDSTVLHFEIETRIAPKTGYIVPFTGSASGLLKGEGQYFNVSYVDSTGFRAIKIVMTDKWDYAGLWMDLPYELDLTEHPYISYEVYSVNDITCHWNYFFDVNGDRNIQNSAMHMFPAAANQWVTISFDYSDAGDMFTDAGAPIQSGRITDVLFNLHNHPGSWPFTDYSGTVFYRNIRIGDQAVIPVQTPVATIDGIPEQVHYTGQGEVTLTLSGISDGAGGTSDITITAVSGLPRVIANPSVGSLRTDGTVDIIYYINDNEGVVPVSVTIAKPGSISTTIGFDINVLKKDISSTALLTLDRSITYQKILGFGAYQNETRWIDLYAGDLGSSAVRAGLIDNQVEPENDNDDPYVLNRDALNYGAFDWDYFRKLRDAGVETFILTSWSPPAWMKRNLSTDWYQPQALGSTKATTNYLEYYYYEEFAESMVAVVRMFEEEAGIHIEAIGIQNEPAFCEPYPSAILDPQDFPRLIEGVGKRFDEEGITTRLFMPEQVFGQTLSSMKTYVDSLVRNTDADKYCDIIAVHGYASDGITSGFPNYDGWKNLWNQAQSGAAPKELWMSETFIEGGSFPNALDLAGAIHGALWAGNVSLWTNWSFGDMQLSRNQPVPSFYTSKNYFKYIRPGAVRIKSITNHEDVMVSAFEHPLNNTLTVVVINKSLQAKSARLSGNNLPVEFSAFRTTEFENFIRVDSLDSDIFILPPKSVTTFISNGMPVLKINQVPDKYLNVNDPEQDIILSGIDDGEGNTAGLSLTAETDNPALITGLVVSGVAADGTAVLSFTPGSNQAGLARIIIRVSDGTHVTRIFFFVSVTGEVNVHEMIASDLKLYPNPAGDLLNIEIPDPSFNELTICDIAGRIMVRKNDYSGQLITIEISGYESGTYILNVSNGHEHYRSIFVVE